MKAVRGALIECDTAVKQVLLYLDESLHFVIENLDDEHLFVDASFVDLIKQKVDEIVELNTYKIVEESA